MDLELFRRAAQVEYVLTDVDGVLTDGGIVFLGRDEEIRRFHVRDGSGIKYAQRAGLKVGFVSGRDSPVVARRAAELGVADLFQGSIKKLPVLEELMARHGLAAERFAYLGDDLIDLPILTRVGLAAAVADAHQEVRARAHLVTKTAGGQGALRELIEVVLKARGQWDALLAGYL
jgi:3-deoxy-D-manno-octulosonate 8-phosphate phosphatase (KDO 8-P phosphatase)